MDRSPIEGLLLHLEKYLASENSLQHGISQCVLFV